MNRHRVFNRLPFRRKEPSPAPPTHQADPTTPSRSFVKSWTTHDSNLALLECLSTPTASRPALPAELILQILDQPTRWVRLHSISHPPSAEPNRPILIVQDRPTGLPVLHTRPISARELGVLRKVVFTFRSRDQGNCDLPDQGSWSWFEAGLAQLPGTDEDRKDHDDDTDEAEWTGSYEWTEEWVDRHKKGLENQPRYRIQTNRQASTEPEEYTIEFTDEDELVQRMSEGDRVVLWACACFRRWENRVYEAKISVVGMDDLTMEREKAGK